MFRSGNLSKAELHFRAALAIKPDYPGTLRGLASIYSAVSKPKTARDFLLQTYRQSPDDPVTIDYREGTVKMEYKKPETVMLLVAGTAMAFR